MLESLRGLNGVQEQVIILREYIMSRQAWLLVLFKLLPHPLKPALFLYVHLIHRI